MSHIFKSFAELAAQIKSEKAAVAKQPTKPKQESRGKGRKKKERRLRDRLKAESPKRIVKLEDFFIDEILFERDKILAAGFTNQQIDNYINITLEDEPLDLWYQRKEFVDACRNGDFDETLYRTVKTLELIAKYKEANLKRLKRLKVLWTKLAAAVTLASGCVTEKRVVGSPARFARQLSVLVTTMERKGLEAHEDTEFFTNQQDVVTDIANLIEYGKTTDYRITFEEPDDISLLLADRAGRKMSKVKCLLPDVSKSNPVMVVPQNIIVQFSGYYKTGTISYDSIALDGLGYAFMGVNCLLIDPRRAQTSYDAAESMLNSLNKRKGSDWVIFGDKIIDTENRDWVAFWIVSKSELDAAVLAGAVPVTMCFPMR